MSSLIFNPGDYFRSLFSSALHLSFLSHILKPSLNFFIFSFWTAIYFFFWDYFCFYFLPLFYCLWSFFTLSSFHFFLFLSKSQLPLSSQVKITSLHRAFYLESSFCWLPFIFNNDINDVLDQDIGLYKTAQCFIECLSDPCHPPTRYLQQPVTPMPKLWEFKLLVGVNDCSLEAGITPLSQMLIILLIGTQLTST